MKEYYSIPLEDEDAQALLGITELIDEPIKSIPFQGDFVKAIEDTSGIDTATFWYDKNQVVGLFFLSTELINLPDYVCNLRNLRFLVIISSEIKNLPINLKNLQRLEYLEFSNDLDVDPVVNIEFPDIFQFLVDLKTIKIDGNFIVYFPSSFFKSINLEEIILEDCVFFTNYDNYLQNTAQETNKTGELPENIGDLRSLRKLYLINIKGFELPSSIINLKYLKDLDLTHSNIKNIEIVFNIKSLETLNLTYCGLSRIPETIKYLTNLKNLNLIHNKLQEIPMEITYCQKLEKLYLTWNRFGDSFENWINNLIKLPQLKLLAIEKGYLRFMPKKLLEKRDLVFKT